MPYRRVGLALLLAAALSALIFPTKVLADSHARIVRLSYVDGDVQMDSRDGRGFQQAFLNMPLVPGTRLATRADGRAEIEFEDGSTVRLAPDTLVETQALDLRSSGAKSTLVDLQEGTAYFNIKKLEEDDDFRVTTGRREFSLNRASHFRLQADRAQVVLAVFKGEVEVVGEGSQLTVRKEETLTLDLNDPARYFLAKGVSGDQYDDWDHEREQYRETYANARSYGGYSSAYSYGVADLNYWGSYNYIPGYGYMWRPYFYDASWSPFSDGGWYFYPGYGWIWVSAYPWGWMPYRYGNWYYIGGHGWCWRPGRHWNNWSPVVVVHNAPAGYRLPVAPPRTGRRDPVVVGRGPSTILPPHDPGPEHLIGNRDLLGRGRTAVGGGASGGVVTPAAGSPGSSSGRPGISVVSGGGSGTPAASGVTGRPAVSPRRLPSPPEREVDIQDAIRDARERRSAGGAPSGGVITNSGSASATPASGGSASSGGSSGVSSPADASPSSGRERIPEPRRQLPPSITSDSPTVGARSGPASGGSVSSGSSGGNSSASAPGASAPAPSPAVGRSPGRVEAPREYYVPNSGSASSAPSAGSVGRSSPGASSGSSGRSSSPSPSSGGGWHGSGAGSGSGSGGGPSSAGSPGAGHSSSSGHSSSPSSSHSSHPR